MVMANVEAGTLGLARTFQVSAHIMMESLNRKSRREKSISPTGPWQGYKGVILL